MISIYRIAGGIAFLLMGIGAFYPMPHPVPIVIGICLIIAAIALFAGM